jgi:uncharacterized damage-inducible protein DinB
MNVPYFTLLYDYHYWANERILRAAASLGAAQFNARVLPNHKSLRQTLVHAYIRVKRNLGVFFRAGDGLP